MRLGLLWALTGTNALAQEVRPADLVAAFESTAVRPLIAEVDRPQAYGGLALGGVLTLGDGFAVPIGGGFGLTDRWELGVDLALGVVPFDVLDRARLYGRFGAVPGHLAVQLGAWLPTERGEAAGLELMLPARWEGDVWQVYGQARASLVVATGALASGVGTTLVRTIVGPLNGALDVGLAGRTAAGQTALALMGGPALGVNIGPATLVRGRLSFPALWASGGGGGLDARTAELVVVRQFGG